MRRIKELIQETFSRWNAHEAPRLGAALTFYTILSLSPLLVMAVAIAALVFGADGARQQIMHQAQSLIGKEGADTVASAMQNAQQPHAASLAGLVSIATLLFGASGVFVELRSALNKVWDVKPSETSGVMAWIKDRFFSIGMVLALGFLLLVSLLASAVLAALANWFTGLLPMPEAVMQAISIAIGLAGTTLIFSLIFRYVPQTDMEWRRILPGAFFTAILFELGRFAIGMYLGQAAVGSAYGAAGSMVVVIVWLYYSSQIFYFGAELTRGWAERHGWQPAAAAAPEPEPERRIEPAPFHPAGPRGLALAAGALAAMAMMIFRRRV